MRALTGILLLSALAACADVPEMEAANRGAAPVGAPPPLLPFDALEAATAGPAPAPDTIAALEARAAALRARAALLRAPLTAEDDIDARRARLDRMR